MFHVIRIENIWQISSLKWLWFNLIEFKIYLFKQRQIHHNNKYVVMHSSKYINLNDKKKMILI